MLLVKTYLDRSRIHGIGLFAAEPIPRGTVLWTLHPAIDIQLGPEVFETLVPAAREQIVKYSYLDPVLRKYVLCGDDARFFNHDDDPNCLDVPDGQGGRTIAKRDIAAGEELTCDYAHIDAEHQPLR
jgi:uncharacterized protein